MKVNDVQNKPLSNHIKSKMMLN